ncbi:CLU domain [Sesbania bispinosa]|nr:CLU domain [Sesbania bispinosa]
MQDDGGLDIRVDMLESNLAPYEFDSILDNRGKNEALKFKNQLGREEAINIEVEQVKETNIKIVVAEKEMETELELHAGTVMEVQEADVANKIEGQESDADLGDIKTKKECFKEVITDKECLTRHSSRGQIRLLYGPVDNGKKICRNEDFHSKVSEAAKRLHLKEHLVLDGCGNVFKLAAPVECKGIVGGDDRHYLLDLLRAQAAETSKSKEKNSEGADDLASDSQNATDVDKPDITEEEKNEDVFTEFKLAGSPEEIAADEDNVRKISLYLIDVVLPKFVQDLCTLEVSPMDSQSFKQKLEAGLRELLAIHLEDKVPLQDEAKCHEWQTNLKEPYWHYSALKCSHCFKEIDHNQVVSYSDSMKSRLTSDTAINGGELYGG